jgi:hypothetical protein
LKREEDEEDEEKLFIVYLKIEKRHKNLLKI